MRSYNYATLGKRTVSFVIDDFTVSILFVIIFYEQLSVITTPELMKSFLLNYSWVLLLLKLIYHTFFIGYNGMTIGKYIVKIRAIDEVTGGKLPWNRAFIRALVRIIGESLLYFTFIYAIFDKKVQTLHDKVVNCVVVSNVKN